MKQALNAKNKISKNKNKKTINSPYSSMMPTNEQNKKLNRT